MDNYMAEMDNYEDVELRVYEKIIIHEKKVIEAFCIFDIGYCRYIVSLYILMPTITNVVPLQNINKHIYNK